MKSPLSPSSLAVAGLAVALLASPAPTVAATSSVECGQLMGYASPDPLGPTDGSLTLGFTPALVIAPDATVAPAADAILQAMAGSGPTCVSVDIDDAGAITSLDIAADGVLRGAVDFDVDSGFYRFADRLIIPSFMTDVVPSLEALFVTSFQAGTEAAVSFTVDTATGSFSAFDGRAAFCGFGSVTQDGDGRVGDAIIPASELDAADLALLAGAGSRMVCASVHSTGTIDPATGGILGNTDVDIDVEAETVAPPETDVLATARVEQDHGGFPTALVLLGSLAMLVATAALVRRERATPR